MANEKISNDPSATALTGAETVPVLQGGTNKKTTVTAIKDFVGVALSGTAESIITIPSIEPAPITTTIAYLGFDSTHNATTAASWIMPACTLKNFKIRKNRTGGGNENVEMQFINVTSGLTIDFTVLAAGDIAEDLASQLSFNAGDLMTCSIRALTTDGMNAAPAFTCTLETGGTGNGSLTTNVDSGTNGKKKVYVDTDTNAVNITLLSADLAVGHDIVIKDITGNAGTLNITLLTEGGKTVDGLASGVVKITGSFGVARIETDGVQWFLG